MDRLELTRALRASQDPHYNCCQSVLMAFREELGLDEATACALGAHFGGGMRMGATCGTITGALMVLGMLGCDQKTCSQFTARFRTRCGSVECRELLRAAHDRGVTRSDNCDRLVYEVVADLDQLLAQKDETCPL